MRKKQEEEKGCDPFIRRNPFFFENPDSEAHTANPENPDKIKNDEPSGIREGTTK
jgi:hypothetical protein